MPRQVRIIADLMLPIAPLPDAAFAFCHPAWPAVLARVQPLSGDKLIRKQYISINFDSLKAHRERGLRYPLGSLVEPGGVGVRA